MDPLAHHLSTMAYNNAWSSHRLLNACERLTHDEVPNAAFGEVVEIGSADAAGAKADEDLARAGNRRGPLRQPEVFRAVNHAGFHRGVPSVPKSDQAVKRVMASVTGLPTARSSDRLWEIPELARRARHPSPQPSSRPP